MPSAEPLPIVEPADLPERQVERARLEEIPNVPGVYSFYNRVGELLYIGKSVRLRDRVRSYFRPSTDLSSRRRRMAHRVRWIGYRALGSELEALLTESQLIKRWRPRHNVLLRNHLNHYFLRVDMADRYPRLALTREPEDDGALHFGPIRGARAAEAIADLLQRYGGFRLCKGALTPRAGHPGCLHGHLGRCLRPCDADVDPEAYRTAVEPAIELLAGRPQALLERLATERDRAAAALRYEDAADLRDAIIQLERVLYRRHAIGTAIEQHHVVVVQPSVETGCRELFFVVAGRYRGQLRVPIDRPAPALIPTLERLYGSSAPTGQPLRADEIDELRIVATWLYHHRDREPYVYIRRPFDAAAVAAEVYTAVRVR